MVTELEIVDTAVKIGLGAFLSGITTYFVTNKIQKHEINKIKRKDTKDLLLACSNKFDSCSNMVNEVIHEINHICFHDEIKEAITMKDCNNKLMLSYNSLKEATTISYIINEKELSECLNKQLKIIHEFALHIFGEKLKDDAEYLEKIAKEWDSNKQKILTCFGGIFNKIYT